VNSGVTLFNTATFYGPLNVDGYGANLRLIRKCLEQPGVDRSKIQLMVKICMDTRAPVEATGSQWKLDGSAANVRADVEYALEQLGVDYIDIIVLCRVDSAVPIEESVAAMAALVAEGKARHIGLSEAAAPTLRRAVAVAPIFCIEQEYSLWEREIESEVIPTCRELGIKIVAYSPLGRGFLTGMLRSREAPAFGAHDFRLMAQPKMSEANFDTNLALVARSEAIAAKNNCTMNQLALAWLHSKGEDIIPIPGTSKPAHLDSNLAARSITLSAEDVAELDDIFKPESVIGTRYAHMDLCLR